MSGEPRSPRGGAAAGAHGPGPQGAFPSPRDVPAAVRTFLDRREPLLALARRHGTPLWVLDEATLLSRARELTAAFRAELPETEVFFPIKASAHPAVLSALASAGLGLEASSGRELGLARAAGARSVLFNGPGKTDAELRRAVRERERVTVILDSALELERLDRLAGKARVRVRVLVRVAVESATGLWRKFGVPPAELPAVLASALACRHVAVEGIHFHTSWNTDPSAQVAAIDRVGQVLRLLPDAGWMRTLDVGGGFWPPQGEWTPVAEPGPAGPFFTTSPAAPIAEFAAAIAAALRAHVFPSVRCRLLVEPGRWICNDAMHLLLRVVDRKGDDLAITDGGTNAVGWERFDTEYFPVVNLSRPSATERPMLVLGSLCTPRDLWGRSYFGEGLEPGDVLLVPLQGAYTWGLRQPFIKPLPRTAVVRADEAAP